MPWSTIDRVLLLTRLIGAGLASLALAAIVTSYTYEVVSRYVFSAPTWWSAELVSYLLCIMTFTMMPYVTATRGHVAVTILVDAIPEAFKGGAIRLLALTGAAACAAMTVFAYGETHRQLTRGIMMMAAQPIPKWWVSIWIVIGFGFSTLEFLRLAFGPAPRTPEKVAEV